MDTSPKKSLKNLLIFHRIINSLYTKINLLSFKFEDNNNIGNKNVTKRY